MHISETKKTPPPSCLPQRPTQPVVFRVVVRVLDCVPATDAGGTVPVVGFVGGKINFAEESVFFFSRGGEFG